MTPTCAVPMRAPPLWSSHAPHPMTLALEGRCRSAAMVLVGSREPPSPMAKFPVWKAEKFLVLRLRLNKTVLYTKPTTSHVLLPANRIPVGGLIKGVVGTNFIYPL